MKYLPFAEIVENKHSVNEAVYYIDELSSLEWKNKRDLIIARDNFECKSCFEKQSLYKDKKYFKPYTKEEQEEFELQLNSYNVNMSKQFGLSEPNNIKAEPQFHQVFEPIILHVHHKYYVYDKLAWEYPNEALISLCQKCHQDIHNSTIIKVYNDEYCKSEINLTICKKCNGSGYISKYHYFKDGICFACNGYKYIELIKK